MRKELFTFKYGSPVTTFKYSGFTNADLLTKTKLAAELSVKEYLSYFSVANMDNKSVILTGGDYSK